LRPISATELIDVPRDSVFALLSDLSIRPSFTDHFMSGFRLERLEPVGAGAAARFRIDHWRGYADTVIDVAERPHLIREHGSGGHRNGVGVFTVWELAEGASPGWTELTVTFWTEPATIFDRLRERGAQRRLRRDFKRALRRLRAIAEEGAAVEHVTVGGGDALPAFAR
jgi:carbon monoxide dehydrogenase subunit G